MEELGVPVLQVDFTAIGNAGLDQLKSKPASRLACVETQGERQVAHPVRLKPRAGGAARMGLVVG